MRKTTERKPFIAPVVDNAAQFIRERGAVTVGELAEYLSAALTGEQLAYWWRQPRREFLGLPVIDSGSIEFVRTIAALLVNRTVDLDATDPALLKLTWDGRWEAHREASQPHEYKSLTGAHYHVLTVRDPGGAQQVAECWEGENDLGFLQQYLDELYLHDFVDEGWEAIFIVGCPDRCPRDEICNLSVDEWGAPYWQEPAFPGVEDFLQRTGSEQADPLTNSSGVIAYQRLP